VREPVGVHFGEGAEIIELNASAKKLIAEPRNWLLSVHPRDRAEVEKTCVFGGRAKLRFTHDNMKYRVFELEVKGRRGILTPSTAESSDAELDAILEALPFEIWERDDGGFLIRQNPPALRARNVKLGSTVADVEITPDVAKLWADLNARAYAGEVVSTPIDYDYASHINIIAPVRDGDRIRGIMGVNIDITAVKEARAERDALQSELIRRERLAALGELAAVVAHEVRNPLGAIFNSLSTLKKHITVDSDGAVLLRILEEEASRLNRTVDDLMNYVRPLQPQRRPEDIVEIVRDAIKQRLLPHIEHDVVSEPLAPIEVDPVLLRIAISNLVTNAAQAMPDGGRLTITIRDEESVLVMGVHDTGKGIPAEVLSRVFEPFFTTRPSGSGLGLAVVRRIVEAHDGSVAAQSDGQGTVFTMRFPR